MAQNVHNDARREARPSDSLASGPINCPAGQETSLISVPVANGFYSELVSLAYAVNGAPPANAIEFRSYLGGVRMNFPYATRRTQLGSIGSPTPIVPARELPGGPAFEIRVFNSDVAAWQCECDGEIAYYGSSR